MSQSPRSADGPLDENVEYLDCHKLYLEQDDLELAQVYDKLARTLFKKYMYQQAMEYFQKAEVILLEKKKPNDIEIARLYHNIAATLYKKGEFGQAEQTFRKAIKILELHRNQNGLHLAAAYENLSNTVAIKGNYKEALSYLEKSLQIKKTKLGERSSGVGDTYSKMGSLFIRLEDFDKALDYLTKGLDLKGERLGDHFEISSIHEDMAGAWGRKQNYAEALKSLEKALVLKEKFFQKDHYVYTRTYSMLGIASELQGLHEQAISHLKKSIELKKRSLDDGHVYFGVDYFYMGRAFLNEGRYDEALDAFIRCSTIYVRNIGKENPYKTLINEGIECCMKKNSLNNSCSICLEELEKNSAISFLQCAHSFHTHCISSWQMKGNKTCPVCRFRFEG